MSSVHMIHTPKYVAHITSIPLQEKIELRVAEYVLNDKIIKVELQYRMHSYNENGQPVMCSEWEAVDRHRIDLTETE